MTEQNLANAMWSLAVLQHQPPSLLEALAARAEESIATFDSRSLSTAAWALAKLQLKPGRLLACIGEQAAAGIDSFSPQVRSNLLATTAVCSNQWTH